MSSRLRFPSVVSSEFPSSATAIQTSTVETTSKDRVSNRISEIFTSSLAPTGSFSLEASTLSSTAPASEVVSLSSKLIPSSVIAESYSDLGSISTK